MSMTLEAPFNAPVTVTILTNPDLDNTEGQDLSLQFKLSIDGTRSTYVKSSARKRMTFTWSNIGRGKLVEVEEFFKLYAGDSIKLTDYRGIQWNVIFGDNPIDINVNRRSLNSGGGRKESGSLTLEFLGAQI
jgi:hypothetical protein